MFDKGFFNGLFDFNRDGKLDSFERAADFMAFNEMVNEGKKDELASAGLDVDELEYMDDDERAEALGDAGFDPDDFDF